MNCKKEAALTSKEKRLIRKERQRIVSAAWDVVQKADHISDQMKKFPAFTKFTCKNGCTVTISSQPVSDLDKDSIEEIFDLERQNMQCFYENCEWGWHDKRKREEMFDDRARYLIARDSDSKILAFSHYRFDLDFDIEVLYCYELQLRPKLRRQGLGKFMLQILELIAFKSNMKKVVLTVLKNNPDAMQFFQALNYEVDETSPIDDAFEKYDYVVMSKKNKKLTTDEPIW